MNTPMDSVTLDAFLAALAQLNEPLPSELQTQLNIMAASPNVDQLDAIANAYPLLNDLYQDAREIFQNYGSERSKGPFPNSPDEKTETHTGEVQNDVVTILSASDSSTVAKQSPLVKRLLNFLQQARP